MHVSEEMHVLYCTLLVKLAIRIDLIVHGFMSNIFIASL